MFKVQTNCIIVDLQIKFLSSIFDMILATLGCTLGKIFSTLRRLLVELERKSTEQCQKAKRPLRLDLCPLDTLSKHVSLRNFSKFIWKNLYQMSWRYRSSHQRGFIKKVSLKNFAKFRGKYLCQSLLFSKVAGQNYVLEVYQSCKNHWILYTLYASCLKKISIFLDEKTPLSVLRNLA